MREQYYQRRLTDDLQKWVQQGRISQENADIIFEELPTSGITERLPSIIAILGAVLICFGILAFVAANWYGVPKATRLILIAVGLWTSYGLAAFLHKRGSLWLFEAVVLIGVSIYATGIVLIAQMYHLDGHYPDAILMAGIGTLVAAMLAHSHGALVIAFGMFTLWTNMEIVEFDNIFHWPFLVAWCASTGVTFLLRSRINYHLATLSFAFWVSMTVFLQADSNVTTLGGAFTQLASLSFITLTVALFFAHYMHKDHADSFSIPLSAYAIKALAVLIFFLQVLEAKPLTDVFMKSGIEVFDYFWLTSSILFIGVGMLISFVWRKGIGYSGMDLAGLALLSAVIPIFSILGAKELSTLIPLAVCILLISLWLIAFGQKFADRTFVNLGFVLFGAEVLYIYFKTFGTLMDSFVFFTIGGVVLIMLAFGLEKFRKRVLDNSLADGVNDHA